MRQNEEYLDEELFDDVIEQRQAEADEFTTVLARYR